MKARTRDTHEASKTGRDDDRTRSNGAPDDNGHDDAPPDMSKERGEERDGDRTAGFIQSVLIAHRSSG